MDSSVSRSRPRRAAALTNGSGAASEDNSSGDIASGLSASAAKAIRRLDWHPSAPHAVLAAAEANDPARTWKAWRRHLAQRAGRSLARLLGVERSPLLWALPAPGLTDSPESRAAVLVELLAQNDRATRKRLAGGASWNDIAHRWLAESRDGAASAAQAIESLAWCHALAWLVEELSPETWCALFERLVSVAADSAALALHAAPLVHQLYAGELSLALAFRFPQLKNTRAMRKPARKALSRGLADLLNGEGLPSWADLAIARPLLASWTRCAAIGREMQSRRGDGGNGWDAAAADQYRWFVLASLRLARRDGSQMFLPSTASGANAFDVGLFAVALRLSGSKSLRTLATVLLPAAGDERRRARRNRRRARETIARDKKKFPKPSYHCEWSGVSVLRPTWRRGGVRVGLAFGAQRVQLELCCGRDVVLAGEWTAEVALDGRRLEPVGTWEESCWLTNRWVDYVELQLPLAENVVLQRHIVLPREDGFVMLADSIVGRAWRAPRGDDEERSNGREASGNRTGAVAATNGEPHDSHSHTIAYRGCIPLGSGIEFAPQPETREAVLRGTRERALVLPLALPEWRSDHRVGTFVGADGTLELRQSNLGMSLVAPLWFDLKPKRFRGERTWRQLTVAEDRRIQPPDRAVGYRVQVGERQWIAYRSLTARGNRTLLSHNLSTEFLVARFEVQDGAGMVDPLVEIE